MEGPFLIAADHNPRLLTFIEENNNWVTIGICCKVNQPFTTTIDHDESLSPNDFLHTLPLDCPNGNRHYTTQKGNNTDFPPCAALSLQTFILVASKSDCVPFIM